jgi:uncharacterized protein (DUF885 family)
VANKNNPNKDDMTVSPTDPHRRTLLQVAPLLLAGLAGCATHLTPESPMHTKTLDDLFADLLAEVPHNATSFGLDRGEHAVLRRRWPDRSLGTASGRGSRYAQWLNQLNALTPPVDADCKATLDATRYALELGVEGGKFTYGDQSLMATLDQEGTPYVINQMIGLVLSAPEFLASVHPLHDADDLAAFLERLSALPGHIDAETERFAHDVAAGVVPPPFVLGRLIDQLDALMAIAPGDSRIAQRLSSHDQARTQAIGLIEQALLPAVRRQRARVRAAMASARATADAPGVGRLPDGERYYAWALRVATTTNLKADEIHRMGIEQSAAIDSRMDALLRAQGMSAGSVGKRMQALGRDAGQQFANDDAGRAAAIEFCQQWVLRLRSAMPRWSALPLRAPVDIRRVPAELESGAAGAYMAPGAVDGSRPSAFYLNLRDTAAWPRWALPTLVAHETVPGHVWQEAHEAEVARRHPIRALLKFNGYSEGWALFAEQLVDEGGFYEAEPLARLGFLQAQQLRATRLVVDTGLHALGWSRERAVQVLADATGRPLPAVESEIDRYCVKPGQACGYMVGQLELLRLRAAWPQGQRGATFNDAVLRAGNLPLAVLAQMFGK